MKIMSLVAHVFIAGILIFGTVYGVYAQEVTPLAGDNVCGASAAEACDLEDLGQVIKNALGFLLQLAAVFIVIMIIYSGVKLMVSQDKAVALNEAKTRIWNVVLGMIILSAVATVGVYVALLKFLGVKENLLEFLGTLFAYAPSLSLIGHAYAADMLPNPTGINNGFDFFLVLIELIIRWIVFPIIIFAWLYTGFKFVAAQGAPEKIKDAKIWLWWVLVGTVIVMLAQGLATSLRETINQITS